MTTLHSDPSKDKFIQKNMYHNSISNVVDLQD